MQGLVNTGKDTPGKCLALVNIHTIRRRHCLHTDVSHRCGGGTTLHERMHPDNTIDPRGGTGYVTSLQISQNAMYIQVAAFTIARDGHIMKW